MFTVALSHRFTPANGAPCALEVRISSSHVGPSQTVLTVDALRTAVRRALEILLPAELAQPAERVAERCATLIAEQLATLPPETAPPGPAWIRVRLSQSPETWAAFERPLLPTPTIR
jgi:hypothetical protein